MNAASAAAGGRGNVRVRLLRDDADIELTMPLVLALHRESRYRRLSFAPEKRREYIRRHFIANPKNYGFIIAEAGDKPVGMLSCAANNLLYSDRVAAVCLVFYVAGDLRKTLLGGRANCCMLSASGRKVGRR